MKVEWTGVLSKGILNAGVYCHFQPGHHIKGALTELKRDVLVIAGSHFYVRSLSFSVASVDGGQYIFLRPDFCRQTPWLGYEFGVCKESLTGAIITQAVLT